MAQLETGTARTIRRDGWIAARRQRFLDCLAARCDVSRACQAVGLSRQSAYRLRARDPGFAAAWDGALLEAREAAIRSFIAALPEALRRTLSGSSSPCHLRPSGDHEARGSLRHNPSPSAQCAFER